MRDQELIGLYEAYQQVHTQQRVINEEVEIASHYFCEMGLNEIGVQILIEELGVEEFAEFVYDISEEYYLTEARAGGDKIEPVTTKGTPFVDPEKISKSSLARLRAQKEKKRAGEASERPSGMKAALQRQAAMVSASNQQPKRKGFLDSVAGAVLDGIKRHKAATDGMGAKTRETAGKIGKAAREFGTGLMNSYDNWVGQLISDGYDLSNWTDEGLFEYYEQLCEENGVLGRLDTLARDTAGRVGGEIGAARGREKLGNILGIPEKIGRERGTQRGQAVYDKAKETVGGILTQSYEYDLYDTILEYLISEGYADTNEAALAIMASMSEDWKYSIVEVVIPPDPVLPPPTRPAPRAGGSISGNMPPPAPRAGGSISGNMPPPAPRAGGSIRSITPPKDSSAGSITLNRNKPGDDFIGPTVSSGGNTYGIPNPKFGRPQR